MAESGHASLRPLDPLCDRWLTAESTISFKLELEV